MGILPCTQIYHERYLLLKKDEDTRNPCKDMGQRKHSDQAHSTQNKQLPHDTLTVNFWPQKLSEDFGGFKLHFMYFALIKLMVCNITLIFIYLVF